MTFPKHLGRDVELFCLVHMPPSYLPLGNHLLTGCPYSSDRTDTARSTYCVLIQVDQQNLTITLFKKKALSKNILAEIQLEVCHIPCLRNGLNWSALASSFTSWRALMVSMICCKVGSSLPSDPNEFFLVFLITPENLNTTVDGIRFYRAPR